MEGSILWRECQDSDRIGATRTEQKNEKKFDEDELKRKSSFFLIQLFLFCSLTFASIFYFYF